MLWTMIDRRDAESPWAAFWGALPATFGTALGKCIRMKDWMHGCHAHM